MGPARPVLDHQVVQTDRRRGRVQDLEPLAERLGAHGIEHHLGDEELSGLQRRASFAGVDRAGIVRSSAAVDGGGVDAAAAAGPPRTRIPGRVEVRHRRIDGRRTLGLRLARAALHERDRDPDRDDRRPDGGGPVAEHHRRVARSATRLVRKQGGPRKRREESARSPPAASCQEAPRAAARHRHPEQNRLLAHDPVPRRAAKDDGAVGESERRSVSAPADATDGADAYPMKFKETLRLAREGPRDARARDSNDSMRFGRVWSAPLTGLEDEDAKSRSRYLERDGCRRVVRGAPPSLTSRAGPCRDRAARAPRE